MNVYIYIYIYIVKNVIKLLLRYKIVAFFNRIFILFVDKTNSKSTNLGQLTPSRV